MARKGTQQQPQIVYALQTLGYVGAKPQTQFTFTAANEAEAVSKARGWARYQGMVYGPDVTVALANENEASWPVHNEWMNH